MKPYSMTGWKKLPAATMSLGAVLLASSASAADPRGDVHLDIIAHLQDIGDVECAEGRFCGTRGQSRRLEGFSISIAEPIQGLSLRYFAHLQDFGDTGWFWAGDFVGTRGQSRRLEGFAIALDGPEAANYEIYYYCHIQDQGDSLIKKTGEFCGTRGLSRRVEGFTVWIKRKRPF